MHNNTIEKFEIHSMDIDQEIGQIGQVGQVEDASPSSSPSPRNLRNIRTQLIAAEREFCTKCGSQFLVLPKKKRAAKKVVDGETPQIIDVLKTTRYHEALKSWCCANCSEIINTTKQTYSIALPLMPKIEAVFDISKQLQTVYRINHWTEIVRQLLQADPNFPRTVQSGEGDKSPIDFNLLFNECDELSAEYKNKLDLCTLLDNLYKEHAEKKNGKNKKRPVFSFGSDEASDSEDDDDGDDCDEAAKDSKEKSSAATEKRRGLTITPDALEKIKALDSFGFFAFVDSVQAKLDVVFVRESIAKSADFLPRIVDTVRRRRALDMERAKQSPSDEKRIFFKRLDGHYNGKPGNCAKKAVTHIWKQLRKIESLDLYHRQCHGGSGIIDLDFNDGQSLEDMSRAMKHFGTLDTFSNNSRLAIKSKDSVDLDCHLDRYFQLYMVRKEISFRYPTIRYIDGTCQKITNVQQMTAIPEHAVSSIVAATRPCKKQLSPYFCTTHLQPPEKIAEIMRSAKLRNMGTNIWLPSVYAANGSQSYAHLFLSKEQKERTKKKLNKQKRLESIQQKKVNLKKKAMAAASLNKKSRATKKPAVQNIAIEQVSTQLPQFPPKKVTAAKSISKRGKSVLDPLLRKTIAPPKIKITKRKMSGQSGLSGKSSPKSARKRTTQKAAQSTELTV